MCNACVINSVKKRMINRRRFFKLSTAAAVVGNASLLNLNAGNSNASEAIKVEDLTHTLVESFPTFGGEQQFFLESVYKFEKDGFNSNIIRVTEHTGTHIDAPLHFSKDGKSVDEIPVENLVVPLVVIGIKAKAVQNADAQLTPDDLKNWIAANGDLPENCCVAMNSGWDKFVQTEKFRNLDDKGVMHFPGFHPETTLMLQENYKVAGIAVDTLSLDFGASQDFATHYNWLPSNRWGIECMANLDTLPAVGSTLIVGAPKHKGGSGGPCRVFAIR